MKLLERLLGREKKTDIAKKTDIDKVTVTSSGRFYMKSEDLFDDKEEALSLIKKLDESVEAFQKARSKNLAHTE